VNINLEEHLEQIVGFDGKEKEAVDIRIALGDHPELCGFRHVTGKVLLNSESINVYCDTALIERHGNDFMALPYTASKGIRLHSSPVVFYVGTQNDLGFGIIPSADWEDLLVKAKIDNKIIRTIRKLLLSHCPVNYHEAVPEPPKPP